MSKALWQQYGLKPSRTVPANSDKRVARTDAIDLTLCIMADYTVRMWFPAPEGYQKRGFVSVNCLGYRTRYPVAAHPDALDTAKIESNLAGFHLKIVEMAIED